MTLIESFLGQSIHYRFRDARIGSQEAIDDECTWHANAENEEENERQSHDEIKEDDESERVVIDSRVGGRASGSGVQPGLSHDEDDKDGKGGPTIHNEKLGGRLAMMSSVISSSIDWDEGKMATGEEE